VIVGVAGVGGVGATVMAGALDPGGLVLGGEQGGLVVVLREEVPRRPEGLDEDRECEEQRAPRTHDGLGGVLSAGTHRRRMYQRGSFDCKPGSGTAAPSGSTRWIGQVALAVEGNALRVSSPSF